MVASSVTNWALFSGVVLPWPGIPRPHSLAAWVGGTGPFNVLHQWDTANTYNTGNLIEDLNASVTSPNEGVPPSDMGPFGTQWFHRAIVIDTADLLNEIQRVLHDHTGGTFTLSFDGQGPTGAIPWNDNGTTIKTELELLSSVTTVTVTVQGVGDWLVEFNDPGNQDLPLMTINGSGLTGGSSATVSQTQAGVDGRAASATQTLNWFDSRLRNRFLYLNPNVGVAFHPKDQPAGGWGVSEGGTVGSDGDNRLFSRFLYLQENVGIGFRFKDEPVGGWGTAMGGTWEFDERLGSRFLHLQPSLTTEIPTPRLFLLDPNFGRPGDAFRIDGWGLMPYEAWAEGLTPTISGWSPTGGGAQFLDGKLPRQTGEDQPDVLWRDGALVDPVFTIDLLQPRLINEVRAWYLLTDPFTSCEIFWSDDGVGFTSLGSITPGTHGDGVGWATSEAWSSDNDFGTHRYWRFSFTNVESIGELEVNRRMTIGTGDIEPRFDDTTTDWLLTISQQAYDQLVAQSPASAEEGGEVRVVNKFPTPDLTSNTKGYTFLDPILARGTGVLIKMYDRDAPEQLLAVAGDSEDVSFHTLLSGIGSAEFTVAKLAPFFEEPGVMTKYNLIRIFLDQVERWWGFVTFTDDTLTGGGGRKDEAVRFFCKHGLSYLSRGALWPKNWPSLENPTWQFIDATAGTMLLDMIASIQGRGTMPRLTTTFTATHDSAGVAWEDTFTMEFQAGTKLDRVVAALVALGIDVSMNSQFVLSAYNQKGFDRTTDPGYVPMMVGHTVEALDNAEDFESPANVALISYGSGKYLVFEDLVSSSEWERFEGFTQSDADNATSAQRIAEAAVFKVGQPLDQIALAVQRIEDEMEPFQDFDLGDFVRVLSKAPTHGGFNKKYRVRAISVDASDVRNPTFSLDLNSIRIEKIIQHEIKLTLQQQNTLPVEVGSSVPGGSAPRDHLHEFPVGGDIAGFTNDPTVVGWQGQPIFAGPFGEGDMWYYDTDTSMWRLVGGTKATGRVPTIQADGTIDWQTPSSSTGPPAGREDEDPTDADGDTFTGTSLGGSWTETKSNGSDPSMVKRGAYWFGTLAQSGASAGRGVRVTKAVSLAVGETLIGCLQLFPVGNEEVTAAIVLNGTAGDVAVRVMQTSAEVGRVQFYELMGTFGVLYDESVIPLAGKFWLGLKYVASNSFQPFASLNGELWVPITAASAQAMTPAAFGFILHSFNNAGPFTAAVHHIDIVSTV